MVKADAGPSYSGYVISELNKIGIALSAERNIDSLLTLILSKSREITSADAGSLYLVERGLVDAATGAPAPDRLRLKIAQNDTVDLVLTEFTIVLRPLALVEQVVVPFTAADEELVVSLACQASVAFERARLLIELGDHAPMPRWHM